MVKLDVVTKDEIEDREIAQELVDKLAGMKEDRDTKCASAKEQLIENLKITADKYRTATGVMEALRVIRMVCDDSAGIQFVKSDIEQAKSFAAEMAATALKMADDVNSYTYEDMHMLCDGYYEKDFVSIEDIGITNMCRELMRLDLCRNVGPAAEDMTEFYKRATADIEDTQAELDELIKKYPELAKLTPTPKED